MNGRYNKLPIVNMNTVRNIEIWGVWQGLAKTDWTYKRKVEYIAQKYFLGVKRVQNLISEMAGMTLTPEKKG